MENITLRQALSVLAKSSPHSVSTLGERKKDIYDNLKHYLYIEQDIEKAFADLLKSAQPGDVIFLCGSSGDGKTEILRRYKNQYQYKMCFHSDGTHSFTPDKTAIDTLNDLFSECKKNNKTLIIGINVGMLANYAKEGNDEHYEIKQAIENFLSKGETKYNQYYFLDFEKFPKFEFTHDPAQYSVFAKALLQRLTSPCPENIFYQLAKKAESSGIDLMLVANYKLLSKESVQDAIITNLFKVRLVKEQFLTTRALLDLLHDLLLCEDYLFNNLFSCPYNELTLKLADFDPALLHTKKLDQLVLRYELELSEPLLTEFLNDLHTEYIDFSSENIDKGSAASLIRLFYLLSNESISNNYHKQFAEEFHEQLLEQYAQIWLLHHHNCNSDESKRKLRNFYVKHLISAIFYYANRNATNLTKGEFFLGQYGNIIVSTVLRLQGDYVAIERIPANKSPYFQIYLKIDNISLKPITLTLSLFELIYKLNQGYRPNRYDKNTIILLDELIKQITDIAKLTTELKIYDGATCYNVRLDDGMIAINGGFL